MVPLSIRISEPLRDVLSKRKSSAHETYEQIIWDLLRRS